MTDAALAFIVASGALGLGVGRLSRAALQVDVSHPDRLVRELRLAQYAALLLVMASGVYVGFALAHPDVPGTSLDIAFATGFFVVAGLVTTWDPSRALTALAVAWTAHAVVDLAHQADLLPAAVAPAWYPTGCAIYDVVVASLCYLPVWRR